MQLTLPSPGLPSSLLLSTPHPFSTYKSNDHYMIQLSSLTLIVIIIIEHSPTILNIFNVNIIATIILAVLLLYSNSYYTNSYFFNLFKLLPCQLQVEVLTADHYSLKNFCLFLQYFILLGLKREGQICTRASQRSGLL